MRRVWLPLVCAVVQLPSVKAGSVADRPGAAAALASALALASAAILLWAHRAPIAVSAAAAALYAVEVALGDNTLPAAVAVMIYILFRGGGAEAGRAPDTTALLAGAAALVAVVVPVAIAGNGFFAAVWAVVLLGAAVAALVVAARATRLAAARQELVVAERLRIARDLHDVVGHGVGAIVVQAGAARMAVGAGSNADATRALVAIEESGRGVLREARWLVGLLRSDDGRPDLAALPALVDNARRCGLDVELDLMSSTPAIRPGCAEAAYRIVQEALTNVVRHSAERWATVTVRAGDDLSLAVDSAAPDPGAPPAVEGNGLRGMRERAAAVGGRLSAGPSPDGSGWTVRADLPLGPRG